MLCVVPGGGPRVLMVEDDPSIAQLYTFKLRREGYEVSVAASEAEGEQAFEREHPAVVCVDARLPGGRGLALAQRLARKGAVVVLLTNDQAAYERPPEGVARALLKARTSPSELAASLADLLRGTPG